MCTERVNLIVLKMLALERPARRHFTKGCRDLTHRELSASCMTPWGGDSWKLVPVFLQTLPHTPFLLLILLCILSLQYITVMSMIMWVLQVLRESWDSLLYIVGALWCGISSNLHFHFHLRTPGKTWNFSKWLCYYFTNYNTKFNVHHRSVSFFFWGGN